MKILYISEYLKKKSWLNVNSNYGKNNHEIRNFLGPENDPLGVPGLNNTVKITRKKTAVTKNTISARKPKKTKIKQINFGSYIRLPSRSGMTPIF